MIGLPVLYVVGGLFFAAMALGSLTDAGHPKRWGNTAFWSLMALVFLAGDHLPDAVNGLIPIAMALLALLGLTGKGEADGSCDGQKNGPLYTTAFYVKEGDAWKLAFMFEALPTPGA